MSQEPAIQALLATKEHDGLRYELASTTDDRSFFLSCLEPGGAVRWRKLLPVQFPAIHVIQGELRVERGILIAIAGGKYSRAAYGRAFTLSLDGALLREEFESRPGTLRAALDHDGLRYELADALNCFATILSCLEPGGAPRWRTILTSSDIEVQEAKLRLEAGLLIAQASGCHCKGNNWCQYTFTVNLAGEILNTEPARF